MTQQMKMMFVMPEPPFGVMTSRTGDLVCTLTPPLPTRVPTDTPKKATGDISATWGLQVTGNSRLDFLVAESILAEPGFCN